MFSLGRCLSRFKLQTVNLLTVETFAQLNRANYCKYESDEVPITIHQHLHLEDGPPDEKIYTKPGVRTVCMSIPEHGNALSIDLMKRLIHSIQLDDDNPQLRCIVLWAKGKIFSAGHDLNELSPKAGRAKHEEVFDLSRKLMEMIINCPVPVIAKVDGHAAASGCQLVAQCDLAICSDKSKFSTPGINVGIFCSTPGIPLVRAVPRKRALHMLFTGLPITAKEALEIGLVNKVTTSNKLDEELDKIVDAITAKSRDVITLGKRFFYKQVDMPLMEAYKQGSKIMVENLSMPDGEEGVQSFLEKRKPKWNKKMKINLDENDDPYYETIKPKKKK